MRLFVLPAGHPPRCLPIALCLVGLLGAASARAQDPCQSDEPLDEAVVVLTFAQPDLQQSLGEATAEALHSMLLEGLLLCAADSPAAATAAASVWISEITQPLAYGNTAAPAAPGVDHWLAPSPSPVHRPPAPTAAPESMLSPSAEVQEVQDHAKSQERDEAVPAQAEEPDGAAPAGPSALPAPPPAQPLAHSPLAGHLRIAISDHITAKMVVRDLQLIDLPRDTWPLAMAIACDELLRASWLELAIAPRRAQVRVVPPAVRTQVNRDLEQARSHQGYPATLFARAALNWYSGGATLFGADVGVRKRFTPLLGATLSQGGRRGQWHQGDLGRGRLSTIHFAGDIEYVVADDQDTRIQVRAGPACLIAYAAGDRPRNMAVVRNRVDVGISAHAGVSGTVNLFPPVGLLWTMDVGYTIRALSVEDSRQRVLTSTKGLEIQVSVGLEFGR